MQTENNKKRISEIGLAVTEVSRLAFSPHVGIIFDAKKKNLTISPKIIIAMQCKHVKYHFWG